MPAVRAIKASRAPFNLDNLTCDICGTVSGRKADLKRHKETHLNDKDKSWTYCSYNCGFRSNQKSNLLHHENIHKDDPRPFVCLDCGKGHTYPSGLLRHRKRHHGYIPGKTTASGGSDTRPKEKRGKGLPKRVSRTIAGGSNPPEASTSLSMFRSASVSSVSSNQSANASSPLSSCSSTPDNTLPATPSSTSAELDEVELSDALSVASPMNPRLSLPFNLPWNWPWTKNEFIIDHPFVVKEAPYQEQVFEYPQPSAGPRFWLKSTDTTCELPIKEPSTVKEFGYTTNTPAPNAFGVPATFAGYETTGALDFTPPQHAEFKAACQETLGASLLAPQLEDTRTVFKDQPLAATTIPGNGFSFSFSNSLTPDLPPTEYFSHPSSAIDFTAAPEANRPFFVHNGEALDANANININPFSLVSPSDFNTPRSVFTTGMPTLGASSWGLGFTVNSFSTSFN